MKHKIQYLDHAEVEELQSLGELLIRVNRCAAVVKGGRRFSFSALVVVGDRKGRVGIGFGKANEVPQSVEKGGKEARKSLQPVSLKGSTIPHRVIGRFGADTPVAYNDDAEHFKYGSLGSEHEFGVPYWIWRALPELFQDKLPAPGTGWQSVGFVFEKGKQLPVGMSQRRYRGFDLVWLNCAFCHAGTVRDTPQSQPRVYSAMPANTFDFRAFMRFLFAAGEDIGWKRFGRDAVQVGP